MSTYDIAKSVLTITDADYAQAPNIDLQPYQNQLLDLDFEGIILAAPKNALPVTDERLPLVIGVGVEGKRDYDLPPPYNSYLVATNLENGMVHLRPFFRSQKAIEYKLKPKILDQGDRLTDEELEGLSSKVAWFDPVSDLLEPISFSKGRWSFSAVYFDQPSNSEFIEISDEKAEESTPIDISSINPGIGEKDLPSFLPTSSSPEVEEGQAAFAIKVSEEGDFRRVFATGIIKMSIPESGNVSEFSLTDHGTTVKVSQVLPISFLVISKNAGPVWSKEMLVPVYENVAAKAVPSVYFTIELLNDKTLKEFKNTTSAIYLNVSGQLFGPYVMQL